MLALADRADFIARQRRHRGKARFVKGAQGRARHHARVVRIAHHLMDRARDLAAIPLILSRPCHFQSPPAFLTLPAGPVPRRPIPVPRSPLHATMPTPPSICSPARSWRNRKRILPGPRAGTGSTCDTRLTFPFRSEEHTSELQSLMRISYADFFLKK